MALIGSGTDSYFAEINRNHPNTELLDLLCYSATPQVHTFDNDAIMSNLPGIAETLRTAALFQGKALPVISTLSLRPRNRFRPQKFVVQIQDNRALCCIMVIGSSYAMHRSKSCECDFFVDQLGLPAYFLPKRSCISAFIIFWLLFVR
jgi:hypothetical protein